MQVKVIQYEFVPKQEGNQGYKLTIAGSACGKRLRVKIRRDSYDFQSSYVIETWAKQTGGLDAGWVEVIRFDALAVKLPEPFSRDEDCEHYARCVAQALTEQALGLLGAADASIPDAAQDFAFSGGPIG